MIHKYGPGKMTELQEMTWIAWTGDNNRGTGDANAGNHNTERNVGREIRKERKGWSYVVVVISAIVDKVKQ